MGRVVKLIVSLILIFLAVPYIAYGVYKYLPEEKSDLTSDIADYMDDIYSIFPKMDVDMGFGVEFIDIYAYTMFYGLTIAIFAYILGIFTGVGSKKKKS